MAKINNINDMERKPKIVVILGPTGSGKSDLAVKLAKKISGEVISADSRQVYRGLNIGTGKITKKEMRGVPHYLLDVASPKKRFSVAEYVKLAEKAITKILEKGKVPIICGGTGLYIDTLLGNISLPEVPPNLKLRKILEKKSAPELFKMLQKLDPARASNIDKNNPRRLVRAIEICKALGSVPPLRQGFAGQAPSKYNVSKIGIKIGDEELKKRINKRINNWFKMGLIKEVRDLNKKGLSWKRMSEIGLEYKLVSEFLQNKIDKKELVQRMQTETWHYVKRQMTWFKRDKGIKWAVASSSIINALTAKI